MKPQLLMTSNSDKHTIHLYEAEIPATFLKKLAQPGDNRDARVTIRHRTIPFHPYTSFRDRIQSTLLASRMMWNEEVLDVMDEPRTNGSLSREMSPSPKDRKCEQQAKRAAEANERCSTKRKKD